MTEDPVNLIARVLRSGAETPDRIAFSLLGPARAERWSYARLIAAVKGVAAAVAAPKGTPLRLDLPMGSEAITAVLGGIYAGRIVEFGTEAADLAGEAALPLLRDWALQDGVEPALGAPARPALRLHAAEITHALDLSQPHITAEDRLFLTAPPFETPEALALFLRALAAGATVMMPTSLVQPAMTPLLLKRHDSTIFVANSNGYDTILAQTLSPMPKLRLGLHLGPEPASDRVSTWQSRTGTPLTAL